MMRIKRQHNLGLEEAKRRLDGVADELGRQFGLSSNWRENTLEVRGSGAAGQVVVTATSVEFNVKLPFALKLMEGPIRDAIERSLDEQLQT